MKKYLLIILAWFGIVFTADANGELSCPVYNSQYKATVAHGSTMVSGDSPYVTIIVEGSKAALGYGDQVTVFVNALDRSTGRIVDTIQVDVFVKGGQTSGRAEKRFTRLPKGVYYNVSIDSASCK